MPVDLSAGRPSFPPGDARHTIAVDGLSGAGKSTVSRAVARRLGWGYLDTGATYRAVTLAALRADSTGDAHGLEALAARVLEGLDLSTDPDHPGATLWGVDVTADLRGDAVTAAVSGVSADPGVRRVLGAWQRRTALAGHGCVAEGRDIGSVVLPDAPLKVWLTAEQAARAHRRATQVGVSSVAAVLASIERRDGLDSSRSADPARPASDAVVLDSSHLDADAVVDAVLALAGARGIVAVSR